MKTVVVILLAALPLIAAGDDVCNKLIPDIENNYYVSKLKVMRNGNPQVSQDLVSCTYRGVTPTINGDLPVVVTALLNTTNSRFTVEVR